MCTNKLVEPVEPVPCTSHLVISFLVHPLPTLLPLQPTDTCSAPSQPISMRKIPPLPIASIRCCDFQIGSNFSSWQYIGRQTRQIAECRTESYVDKDREKADPQSQIWVFVVYQSVLLIGRYDGNSLFFPLFLLLVSSLQFVFVLFDSISLRC